MSASSSSFKPASVDKMALSVSLVAAYDGIDIELELLLPKGCGCCRLLLD